MADLRQPFSQPNHRFDARLLLTAFGPLRLPVKNANFLQATDSEPLALLTPLSGHASVALQKWVDLFRHSRLPANFVSYQGTASAVPARSPFINRALSP
jgi:hypothetical protein